MDSRIIAVSYWKILSVYILRDIFLIRIILLTYDNAQEGADFILRPNLRGDNIVIEVGKARRGFPQINYTARRVKMKYGLGISMSQLRLSDDKMSVTVPLSYFLLT